MSTISFNDLPAVVTEILEKVNSIDRQLRAAGDVPGRTEDGLLTISGAGELLSLSTNTIYKLVQNRALPYSKKGKRLYFVKKELLDWVKLARKRQEQNYRWRLKPDLLTQRKTGDHENTSKDPR